MTQGSNDKPNGKARPAIVPCPICGTPLVVGLLEIPEDDGSIGTLFTFDCPTSDYHGTLREAEVREMFAREVVRRLRLLEFDD